MLSQLHHRIATAATMVVIGATLVLASPAAATESTETTTCTDKAWANYNTCLVKNAAFEWAMKECDIAFEAAYAACYPGVVGFFAGLFK